MASAAEAEITALFLNTRIAIPLHRALIKMGHPQPATKIKTDNNTADKFVNGTIKQNKTQHNTTKTVEMGFNWLKCRSAQLQFDIYWVPIQENVVDFSQKKSLICSPQSLTTNLSCT